MNRQPRFNALASPLQGLFIAGSGYVRDGSTRRKPFQILLHFRDSAQKVSKLKPKGQIRSNPLFFP